MKKYRSAALALAACAACLSVAACSTGSPAASSSTASSAGPSKAVSAGPNVGVSSAPPTSGPVIPGRMLAVKGPLGSFPVPAGAKVGENMGGGSSVIIVFGSVTPPDVSRFYATALPKAGYTITTNTMVSKGGNTGALIEFSGHGFAGNIDALDQLTGPALAGLGDTDVTTILFSASK
jgi:hypothetical protein